MATDEWGFGTARIGRRMILNGSDYYQPLMGPELSEDGRALDMSACYNRRLLAADCSFSYAVAEIFYGYATETERPWGLRQAWAVTHRAGEAIPPIEDLIAELLQAGYWIEAGERLRLADAPQLKAYWRWFDAEKRRRRVARQIPELVRRRILARDNHRCALCGTTSALVIDHIHPVAEGGGNDEANLRTLCRKCNADRNLPTPPHAIYRA